VQQLDSRVVPFAQTKHLIANILLAYSGEEIWIPMKDLNPGSGPSTMAYVTPEHDMKYYLNDLKKACRQ